MAYTNPGWTNGTTPAINATNMNNISNAIVDLEAAVATTVTKEGIATAANVGATSTQPIRVRVSSGSGYYYLIVTETGISIYKDATLGALKWDNIKFITPTYTNNAYLTNSWVSNSSVEYNNHTGIFRFNTSYLSSMPAGTTGVKIGNLGISPNLVSFQNVPSRTGNGVIMVTVQNSGDVIIGNYTSSAVSGYFQAMIPIAIS